MVMTDNLETVILIHGLWMRGIVLLPYQRWLRDQGFAARRFSYPCWRNRLAGKRSNGFGLGRLIPGLARPNDGLVAVDETRIPAARDSLVLNISHSGMLVSRACTMAIANFLKRGSFVHA